MSSKPTIGNAGNVIVPAYLSLVTKGYTVRCEKQNGGSNEIWYAENDTVQLLAEDVVSLAGLAAIFETRGVNWRASDEQIESFMRVFGH